MTSRTDKMSAGITRAAYVREYRKIKLLEEDNCNNIPKRNDSVNIEKHINTYLLICNTLKITVTIAHKIKSSVSAC
jgi:hypothetical protein